MRKFKSYSDDFKKALIEEIDSGLITVAEAARREGIARSLIDRWRKLIHEGTMRYHPTPRERQLEKELEMYKKKVGEQAMLIDVLKKINDYCQQKKKLKASVVTSENLAQYKKDAKS